MFWTAEVRIRTGIRFRTLLSNLDNQTTLKVVLVKFFLFFLSFNVQAISKKYSNFLYLFFSQLQQA
jgi:hypothetical protein